MCKRKLEKLMIGNHVKTFVHDGAANFGQKFPWVSTIFLVENFFGTEFKNDCAKENEKN